MGNKTYRLKKWYPTLPKDWDCGLVVGVGDRDYYYSPTSCTYTDKKIDNRIVEDNPEFWEEVIEKNYKILSLFDTNREIKYGVGLIGWRSALDTFYNSKASIIILSVKRLSDNEVFSVGDLVNYNKKSNYGNWKINNFLLKNNKILSRSENNAICEFIEDLKHVEKIFEKIYTTEDGYNIYDENELLWDTSIRNFNSLGQTKTKYFIQWELNDNKDRFAFKHKANAEKWIEENKPQFTKNDMLKFANFHLKTLTHEDNINDDFNKWLKTK